MADLSMNIGLPARAPCSDCGGDHGDCGRVQDVPAADLAYEDIPAAVLRSPRQVRALIRLLLDRADLPTERWAQVLQSLGAEYRSLTKTQPELAYHVGTAARVKR